MSLSLTWLVSGLDIFVRPVTSVEGAGDASISAAPASATVDALACGLALCCDPNPRHGLAKAFALLGDNLTREQVALLMSVWTSGANIIAPVR